MVRLPTESRKLVVEARGTISPIWYPPKMVGYPMESSRLVGRRASYKRNCAIYTMETSGNSNVRANRRSMGGNRYTGRARNKYGLSYKRAVRVRTPKPGESAKNTGYSAVVSIVIDTHDNTGSCLSRKSTSNNSPV